MKIATRTLDNGLRVITHETHHAPVAASFIWYRVGARNEVPGITGISHWVEHMLFKGTARYPKGALDNTVTRHGGLWNGFTWLDYTAYFEVLPSEHLELALDIESNRMVNCLFDPGETEKERTVIISERAGSENQPTFWLHEAVNAAAFQLHPYRQGVIGALGDLKAITRDDLYRHYQTYYTPNNAVAIIAGDFGSEWALNRVEEYFGGIEAGPEVPAVRPVEPPQQGERRVSVHRPGGAHYCEVAFHGPSAADPDFYPLLVIDSILSGGKPVMSWGSARGMGRSSRLYKALVDTALAARASSRIAATIDPGVLSLSITPRPGVDQKRIERAAFQEVASLIESPVSDDELARAQKQLLAQYAYGSEGAMNLGLLLGMWEMVDDYHCFEEYPDRISSVSAADVQRTAARYLTARNRTVGWFIPEMAGQTKEPPQGGVEGVGGVAGAPPHRDPSPQAGLRFHRHSGDHQTAGRSLPGPDDIQRIELGNGMVALIYLSPALPFVVASAEVNAGSIYDPADPMKKGLAALVSRTLLKGTQRMTAGELNETTDGLGMAIGTGCGRHWASATVQALPEDLDAALGTLADVLQRPIFPEDEVQKVKGEIITALKEEATDTQAMAEKAFSEAAYAEGHPYHYPVSGDEESLNKLSVHEVRGFHSDFYRPQGAILAIVGSTDAARIKKMIERHFAAWANPTNVNEPAGVELMTRGPGSPRDADAVTRRHVDIPGKTQADIAMGLPLVERTNDDFYALYLLNTILGQLGLGGRLGKNLRSEQGLAYYVYSRLGELPGTAPWVIRAGVDPANLQRAIDSILKELKGIVAEPITAEELADAKGFITGSLPLRVEKAQGMAGALLLIEHYGLGLDYLHRYREVINGITADDLTRVAAKYLKADGLIVVTAGPSEPHLTPNTLQS